MKASLRGTPGVLHKCHTQRCHVGVGPDQGGKGADNLLDR